MKTIQNQLAIQSRSTKKDLGGYEEMYYFSRR